MSTTKKYDTLGLIKEINEGLPKKANGEKVTSISTKDERAFMRSMINDADYLPERKTNTGESFCATPRADLVAFATDVVSKAAKVSMEEATKLVENHEFTNANADRLINLSKDFILGYTETGRKIHLGSGADYNISLAIKKIEARENRCPRKDANGNVVKVQSPAYTSMKVFGKNPSWNKK